MGGTLTNSRPATPLKRNACPAAVSPINVVSAVEISCIIGDGELEGENYRAAGEQVCFQVVRAQVAGGVSDLSVCR